MAGGITFLEILAASIPTPPAGKVTFFISSADGLPYVKDDAGTVSALAGIGVPVGGTAGQVLAKINSTNYNTQWIAAGAGDVVGPASAVADRITVFDSMTGKLVKDGGKTIADLRTPSVQTVTSSATVTPTFLDDIVLITAQASALNLANPTGTAIPNLGIVIRIKDNGTARAITYGTQYRAIGITLPTTTVISKTLYIGMIFNSTDTKWDVLAVGQEA